MKKRMLAGVLVLVMMIGILPVMVLAKDDVVEPEDLVAAVNNASSGDTIYLGEGTYTLYKKDAEVRNKDLTFVGAGADKTTWLVGPTVPDPKKFGTEYNSDYSFDVRGTETKETVTFKNMTLQSGRDGVDYLGFAGTDNTVVENCVIEGKTCYWGYTSATFTNTTFICPPGDYAIWTYSSPTMTFDHCEFQASGKVINVYTDYGAGKQDITVNFNGCTVTNTGKSLKPVLNINDSNMGDYNYILNITGDNRVSGVDADDITCSRLFGFGRKPKNNAGKTVVKFGDTTVWKDGGMVDDKTYHNSGVTADGVAYTNDVDGSNDSLYAEGYKDNVINVTAEGDWVLQTDGSYKRTVTRVCKYCGYTETVEETKRDNIDDITAILIPALQANTDDHYAYLIGYSDGTVRPNGKITRAEVATIFFRLLSDDTRAKYWSSKNDFSDVPAGKWYNNAVSTLSSMGVIGGYADGTFRPDAPISRAEFAKIAVSFTQNTGAAAYNYFTDVKTTDWFAPYVTAAKDGGLIEGYSDGSFKPENKITRAEACAIVNRTLGRKPSKSHMKISGRIDWPDVQPTDWYYEAIMEATNSHTCQMGKLVETWNDKLPQRDWAALETGWANAYTGNGGEVR